MGSKTSIEWTRGEDGIAGASWTPIRARYFENRGNEGGKERIGWHCERISDGCRNCYAGLINVRLGTGLEFKPGNLYRAEHEGYANGEAKLFLDETMLLAPLRWKRPRRVFVCSMTDLFAEFVPDEWIDRVFAVMALAPQHTFQCLTKRSKRMRDYCSADAGSLLRRLSTVFASGTMPMSAYEIESRLSPDATPVSRGLYRAKSPAWPVANIWLGVSCEDQPRADERVPDLLATPAAVRFVSLEPLLGEINIANAMTTDAGIAALFKNLESGDNRDGRGSLHWVIVGGESGPGARPMRLEWARSIVNQCAAANVACFVKQMGANPRGNAFRPLGLKDRKGGDPLEWPIDLRVRQMPERS